MAFINFQPSDHFNTLLYTGTGSSNAVTGVGFRPDWVWIKGRDFSDNHNLYDIVRGVEKRIVSNSAGAEEDRAAGLTAFGSDGFTVNTANGENKSSAPIVAWNWKAGNAQGSSNTDGTINTTYTSVNTTAGFSISKYVGTGSNGTIGHGLGAVPKWILVKNLDTSDSWNVYHTDMGNGKRLLLDTNGAANTNSTPWNDTSPTSSLFSVGTNTGTNKSGSNLIAYAFAEKKGFSRFGYYKGNGDLNGPFIYTGFKPGFVIIKNYYRTGEHWFIHDTKRQTFNVNNKYLLANESSAEATSNSHAIDILSNGFKTRTTNESTNYSTSDTYIYMAFAEEPLVSSNNIPATAR